MTPPTPHPLRCNHECVCSPYWAIFGETIGKDDRCCVRKNCEHDTRKIPAVNVEAVIKELEEMKSGVGVGEKWLGFCHGISKAIALLKEVK